MTLNEEEILALHEAWENEVDKWKITDVSHGRAVVEVNFEWVKRNRTPDQSLFPEEEYSTIFDTKSEAIFWKRDKIIRAMFNLVSLAKSEGIEHIGIRVKK